MYFVLYEVFIDIRKWVMASTLVDAFIIANLMYSHV